VVQIVAVEDRCKLAESADWSADQCEDCATSRTTVGTLFARKICTETSKAAPNRYESLSDGSFSQFSKFGNDEPQTAGLFTPSSKSDASAVSDAVDHPEISRCNSLASLELSSEDDIDPRKVQDASADSLRTANSRQKYASLMESSHA
jgi:hypothetical protein